MLYNLHHSTLHHGGKTQKSPTTSLISSAISLNLECCIRGRQVSRWVQHDDLYSLILDTYQLSLKTCQKLQKSKVGYLLMDFSIIDQNVKVSLHLCQSQLQPSKRKPLTSRRSSRYSQVQGLTSVIQRQIKDILFDVSDWLAFVINNISKLSPATWQIQDK